LTIQPVVIYEEDARELAQRLDAFLRASRSSLVILIDRSGQIIAERGYSRKRDVEELAALAAAAFAATEQVAKLIGETSFSVLFHQGEERNIHLSVVGDAALMLTTFDDRTTLGLVRLYAGDAAQSLMPVMQRIRSRSTPPDLPDMSGREFFRSQ